MIPDRNMKGKKKRFPNIIWNAIKRYLDNQPLRNAKVTIWGFGKGLNFIEFTKRVDY